jgi:hypothetical protein
VSTGDAVLDAWLSAAAWLFLIGTLLVVASAVPPVVQRFPRVLMLGFMLAIASIALAFVAALTLG